MNENIDIVSLAGLDVAPLQGSDEANPELQLGRKGEVCKRSK